MFLNVFIQKFLKKYNIALYCVFSTFSWLMSLTQAGVDATNDLPHTVNTTKETT